MTLAGALRPVAGGTIGGLVTTALISGPCGGPKSPFFEPPESATAADVFAASSGLPLHPAVASTANAAARNNERGSVTAFTADSLMLMLFRRGWTSTIAAVAAVRCGNRGHTCRQRRPARRRRRPRSQA